MFSLTPLPGGLATVIYAPVLRQYGQYPMNTSPPPPPPPPVLRVCGNDGKRRNLDAKNKYLRSFGTGFIS